MKYGQHCEKFAMPIFKALGPVSTTVWAAGAQAPIKTARIKMHVITIVRFISTFS
jgi:hypothetical protein